MSDTEGKTTAETKAEAKIAKAAAKVDLARAAESGDPAVHQLLAQRQAHVSNLAAIAPPAADPLAVTAAEDAIKDVDDRLAELGYTAS